MKETQLVERSRRRDHQVEQPVAVEVFHRHATRMPRDAHAHAARHVGKAPDVVVRLEQARRRHPLRRNLLRPASPVACTPCSAASAPAGSADRVAASPSTRGSRPPRRASACGSLSLQSGRCRSSGCDAARSSPARPAAGTRAPACPAGAARSRDRAGSTARRTACGSAPICFTAPALSPARNRFSASAQRSRNSSFQLASLTSFSLSSVARSASLLGSVATSCSRKDLHQQLAHFLGAGAW